MNNIWTLRAVACATLAATGVSVWAQAPSSLPIVDPAATQRNIEQGLGNLQQPVQPLPQQPRAAAPAAQAEADIQKLVGVQVQTPSQLPKLAQQIEDYWLQFLQKPVRGVQVNEFKSWLWDQLQRQGYLGYITVQPQTEADGTLLRIAVQAPTIGRATVLTLDAQEQDPLANLVAQRFAKAYPEGTLVDVQGIEAQLSAIAYDLPVNLEASLRQVGSEKVDVVINLKRVDAAPGKVTSAVVQLNNYGLKTYSREMANTVIRVAGPTPLSEFVGVAQVAKGVVYLSGQYSQPIEGWASRWKLFGTAVESKTDATQPSDSQRYTQRGQSYLLGANISTLLRANRYGTWHSLIGLNYRESKGDLTMHNTGVTATTRDRRDNQVVFGLRSDHKLPYADKLVVETNINMGHLKLKPLDTSYNQPDAVAHLQGNYQFLSQEGLFQKALPADERWTFTARWGLQFASQNLDGKHKFALGGVNAIRAFDSDEGVGDEGVLVLLDLQRYINPDFYAGVFYDAGRVRTNKKPSSSSYSLQGAGVSMGGKVNTQVEWKMSVAKSHGSTPAQGINGKIGDWRAYFSTNWRY